MLACIARGVPWRGQRVRKVDDIGDARLVLDKVIAGAPGEVADEQHGDGPQECGDEPHDLDPVEQVCGWRRLVGERLEPLEDELEERVEVFGRRRRRWIPKGGIGPA